MADAERATCDRVNDGDVGRPVVGEQLIDLDAVAAVERSGAAQECDCAGGLLVWKHLGVSQAAAIVDRDMHALPADQLATRARAVAALPVVARASRHALAGTVLDPAQLLDINVHELAGTGPLVALRGLEAQAAELAHPNPLKDPRDRR